MTTPGSNLLNKALTVLGKQTVAYFQATSRALNNIGLEVTTYAEAVNVLGSWQPVPRRMYKQYGLDLQKDYYTFYASKNIIDLERDVSGDILAFDGMRYQAESNVEWFAVDGWNAVLCVKIDTEASLAQNQVFGFNTNVMANNNQNFGNGNFYAG